MKKQQQKKIAIINPNGGVAKTNTARTIARGLQLHGKNSVLIESDPQGSLKAWRDMSSGNTVIEQPEIYEFSDINKAINFDVLIIDGAAANIAVTKSIADIADMIIIPVQASPDDFIQLGELLALVNNCNAFVYILLTRVRKNSKWLALAEDFIFKHQLKSLGYIRETEAIKHAAYKGLTAHECGHNSIAKIDADDLNYRILHILFNE